MWGQDGKDAVYGGADDDDMYGELDKDTMYGNDGEDAMVGERGGVVNQYLNPDDVAALITASAMGTVAAMRMRSI